MKRLLLPLLCASALSACSSVGKRLLSADPSVRAEALQAAVKADSSRQKAIVDRMKKVLSEKNPERRIYAAEALEDIGPASAEAAPQLIAVLPDTEVAVALSAERALIKLPGAAPALASRLETASPALKEKLVGILSAQGEAGAGALAANFEKGNKELAIESTVALARMGAAAGKAVPTLARAAISSDMAIRGLALAALADIGRPAGLWLAGTLRSSNPRYRLATARILAGMSPPPVEAMDALAGAVWDEDEKVRLNAAAALAGYTPEMFSALREDRISGLQKAAERDDKTAEYAARALIKTGKAPISWLVKVLRSGSPAARSAAVKALAKIKPPPLQAAGALIAALKDGDVEVRRTAAAALGGYSFAAAAAFPGSSAGKLAAALSDPDSKTRLLAVSPLGRLASSDKRALASLTAALKHSDGEVRLAAAAALAALGRKAASAEAPLWAAFKTTDCRQKVAAAKALAAVKPRLRKLAAIARQVRRICPAPKKPASGPATLPGL